MKKNVILIATIFINVAIYGQVGINTDAPKATLDVIGKPADTGKLDGIIAPRLTGAELRAKTYTPDQTGALIYVTAADPAPAGQTVDVTAPGYYYFNGTKWLRSATGSNLNIYNSDGTLTSNRTLILDNKTLQFSGIKQRTFWSNEGRLYQHNLEASGGVASMGFDGGNNSRLFIQQFSTQAQIYADGNNGSLTIGTHATAEPSFLKFSTSIGGGALSTEKMRITADGNVGIGTTTPTSKLDIDGNLRVRNILSSSSTGDVSLVADANGVIKKRISETKGIFRGYLSSNFTAGDSNSTIYKVMNWTKIDDPNNDFNATTGLFTAPESGLYRITITGTSTPTGSIGNYVYGFTEADTNQWVVRFSIPQGYIESGVSPEIGAASTFVGVVSLQAAKTYYFGVSARQTLLSNPSGATGSGIGSFFEIQLIKN